MVMSKDNEFISSLRSKDSILKAERERLLAEMAARNARLQALNGAIAGIEQLLRIEGIGDLTESEPSMPLPETPGQELQFPEILKSIMADRKPYTVSELEQLIRSRGFNFAGKHPQRVIGFTLMGLQRGGKYTKDEAGRWTYSG